MATKRSWSASLLLLQLLLCWSALTIDETATTASQGEENDQRAFHRDQILYPTTAEDTSNAVDDQKVLRQLAAIYDSSIKPAERQSHYISLGISRSTLSETTLLAKPTVLFVGPWSTGKTTSINYLLGGHGNNRLLRGAEPTTSHFTVINYGERAGQTDGPILAADSAHPLTQLEQFGPRALQHVTELRLPHRLLANLTLVDTPGMFENQAQRERGYPYDAVLGWFADRADLIVVMFDPARVEIGHEMTQLFRRLSGRHPSVRIVLNKADSIDEEQLMRIYGALLWSLSPLLNESEAPRVYLSSLWSRSHQGQSAFKRLLERDEQALLNDIRLTIEDGVRNKIALVRQQAQRVRMHYMTVDAIVQAYRRSKGANEEQNSRLLADIIANPTKYGIPEAVMARTSGIYEPLDAADYSTYFRAVSIDDHRTIDELCASDRNCAFLRLQDAIDVRLTDLIRWYSASNENAPSSESDNDNEDAAEASPSNIEAAATDSDEQHEETDAHSHEEHLDESDENTSSETDENRGNKTEDEWESKMHEDTPQTPSSYVREASGSFLFAEAAASNPTEVRKKRDHKKQVKEVEEIDADADDDEEQPDKLKCRYRKSCYATGEVPKLKPKIFDTPPAVKAEDKVEKKEEEDDDDDDDEKSERQKKLRCRYRKSCYDTGVVPNLKWKPPVPVKHVEPDIAYDDPKQSLEARCRYRKSCYDTGKLPEDLKASRSPEKNEKEHHHKKHKHEAHSKDKHDEESAPKVARHSDSEKPTTGHTKKPHKPHRTEQETKEKKREEERKEKRSAVKQRQLVQVATLPADVMKLQCRYRISCYRTGVIVEHPAKAERVDRVDTSATDEQEEAPTEDDIKLRCRYRKSCYGSYGLQVKLDEREEAPEEDEASVEEQKLEAQKARLQLVAKWILHTLKEAEEEAKDKPRLIEVASPVAEVNEKLDAKNRCRYRKSCYESGVTPKLEPQIAFIPSFATADDSKEDEETEEGEEVDAKLRCRYRKSCYETGILPDLEKEAAEAAAIKRAEAEALAAALINRYTTPQLRCRYRKSCYRTGKLPDKFFATPEPEEEEKEESIAERIFTEAIPTTISDVKLFCRYRKSCYKRAAEMQLLLPEEESASSPEKGRSPSDDDDDDQRDAAELKPCKPYQKKNCIKVEDMKEIKPVVVVEIAEPEAEPGSEEEETKLKPCKPHQRKNCIKVDEDEGAEVPIALKGAKEVEEEDDSEEKDSDDSGEQLRPIHSPAQEESDEQESEEDKSKESDGETEADDSAEKEEEKDREGEESEEEEQKVETVPVPIVVPIPSKSEKEIKKESASEEKTVLMDYEGKRDDTSMKLACKYKISCYKKAGIDYKKTEKDTLPTKATHSHVAQLMDSKDETDKMKAALLLGQLARDQANRKTKCHYRKSCYDTITSDTANRPQEKVVQNVLEDLETAEDAEDEDETKRLIKLRCHYRKSCYETGILPDLSPREPVLKTNQELRVETGEPTVELKCKYRKSCYESGQVPVPTESKTDFTAAPPAADFAPSIRPKTISDMKLLCHYRKSCYEKFDFDEEDVDGKSVDEEADKKKSSRSPPHPTASPKDAQEEAAAPKATIEQKTVSAERAKIAKSQAGLLLAEDGTRCHKHAYRISCRDQLGLPPLPPKEKIPIGPNGKKLCRKKPKSS